jgi:glycosyltransferase involved in cell wall biosynthesis
MSNKNIKVAAPFGMPVYRHLNGRHPLLMQLLENARGFDFLDAVPAPPTLGSVARALREASELAGELLAPDSPPPAADRATTVDYLHSRDLASQAQTPPDADLTFLHTAPLGYGARPWVLHLENVTTLFWPYLHNGRTRGVALRRTPIFPLISRVLAAPDCRALFTHCRQTVAQLERLFPDSVARKVRYAPPGVHLSAAARRSVDQAMTEKHRPGRTVRMLFTNSWHQAPENFRNRGGLEVVKAFVELHRVFPDVHLTVRSAFPPFPPGDEIGAALAEHPAITVVDGPVSDDALSDMLADADIFLLPSAALHSVSVMRAMAYGAVCVVSDLPVFAEFLQHGESGVVIPGRHAKVYDTDPESGWEQEDYQAMRSLDRAVADDLTAALLDLCRNPERRRDIAAAARRRLDVDLPFSGFLAGFENVLREAAEPGATTTGRRIDPGVADALAQLSERDFGLYHHPYDEAPIMSGEYRGFNIVWLRGRAYAVRQGASEGDLDLTVGEEELRRRLSADDLIVADNIDMVRLRIDGVEAERRLRDAVAAAEQRLRGEAAQTEQQLSRRLDKLEHGPAGDPDQTLVAGAYRGFNIVWRGGQALGLRQGVEAVDPAAGEARLRAAFSPDDVVIGGDEEAVKLRIDALHAEADLRRRVDVMAYGPAGDPAAAILAGAYRDFNLVWRNGKVYGLRQGAGEADWSAGDATLRERHAGTDLVIGGDEEAVKLRIDALHAEAALRRRLDVIAYGPAGAPEAVVFIGVYRDFNIVRHAGRVFAVRQGQGEVDVREGEDALRNRLSADGFIAADSVDAALCRIDLVEIDRRRLTNRLFGGRGGDVPTLLPPPAPPQK